LFYHIFAIHTQVLTLKSVRWQIISGIVIASSLQLCGINGVQFYLDDVFIIAGISPEDASYVSIGVTGAQVILTLIGVRALYMHPLVNKSSHTRHLQLCRSWGCKRTTKNLDSSKLRSKSKKFLLRNFDIF